MKKLIMTSLLCLGPITQAIAAQETPTRSAAEVTRDEAERAPEGWIPFITINGGYTGYDKSNTVEGNPASLKLLGSYYMESPYVFDIGYGVNNQQFTSAARTQETAITGGALELAARYRWESRWQAGLIGNQLFEQGRNLSADQGDAAFVGLQVLREFNMTQSWLARIGLRAMGLANNTGDQVGMYMVDFQFGWNPGATKPSARQTAAQESPVKREMEERVMPSRPVAQMEPTPILKDIAYSNLVASGGPIRFQGSRVAISTKDQQKLSKVAKALNENKDLFERVEIHGFSDTSGSSTANQRISQVRANRVRTALRNGGLKDVDVVAMGKGSADSTNNPRMDRRAEMMIIGVKDESKLREILSGIE